MRWPACHDEVGAAPSRGQVSDWAALRQAVLEDRGMGQKVLQICRAHISDPYAQRYHFWKIYVERQLT